MSSRDLESIVKRMEEKEKKLTLDDIDVESDLNVFTYQASQIKITLEHTLPKGSYSVEDIYDPYIAVYELEEAGDKLVKRIPLLKEAVKKAKAFELIKEKSVDALAIKQSTSHTHYNIKERVRFGRKVLTQEEFDWLKEVLL